MAALSGITTAEIGPNAVTRTLEAITARGYPSEAKRIASAIGLPPEIPDRMIPEAWFVDLVCAVRGAFAPAEAEAILADSGRATAAYVSRNRIPAAVRLLLRLLPSRVALPLLLTAIERHAWTFAGSGRFGVEGRPPRVLVIANAPTCRREASSPFGPTSARGGAWYEAAFEGLLRLADRRIRIREVECVLQGHPACRYAIDLDAAPRRRAST